MTLCLDLSNYTTDTPVPGSGAAGGLITANLVDCWKAQGFSHAIVGTQWPVVAQHQLQVCQENGMTLDAYHWLWFDRDFDAELQRSLRAIAGFPIRRLWVDIEDAVTRKPANELMTIAHRVLENAQRVLEPQGISVGIYTARWWWPDKMDNDQSFQAYPLWHAQYLQAVEGQRPSHIPTQAELENLVTYGGWRKAAMWQYAGSVKYICASNLDLNVTYEEVGEEMFTVFNSGPGSVGVNLADLAPSGVFNILEAFGLPTTAKRVRFQATLTPGVVEIYHGLPDPDNRDAGRLFSPYGWLEVIPDGAGNIFMLKPQDGGGAERMTLDCLGYFT